MSQDPFEIALGALERKERTRAEIVSWLAKRGFDPDELADAIARLEAIGELDDERFARRFADDKRELRGWGPQRISEALASRGVEQELVEAALATEDHAEQLERAVSLLADRGDPLADDAARARALSFLTRRGYDYELAYAAVRRFNRAA